MRIAHDPGRRERRLDLAAEARDEQRQVQRLGHARPRHVALERELDGRLEQVLHVERGDDLDAAAGDVVAGVLELVDGAGGDDDGLAGLGHDAAEAAAELHPAGEHVEALLLLGVHVCTGDAAVRRELELELEQLAVRVARRSA